MVRAIWFLRNFDLLKHMSEQDMLSFERLTSMVHVDKGETVFLPADPADCVYLLKKGMVEIAQVSGSGKQLALSVVGPGEVFGELALVSEGPRGCMARALQNSLVCLVPKNLLVDFLTMHPEFSLNITKLIGLRRQRIESRISDLVFRSVPCRLARILLELISQYGIDVAGGKQIKLRMTHKDLARLAGTTRETVSTWFGQWKKQGILNSQYGKITIHNPSVLTTLSMSDHPVNPDLS